MSDVTDDAQPEETPSFHVAGLVPTGPPLITVTLLAPVVVTSRSSPSSWPLISTPLPAPLPASVT